MLRFCRRGFQKTWCSDMGRVWRARNGSRWVADRDFPRNWRELRRNSTKASAAIAMLALGYCLFAILAVVLLSAKGLARL
jgi:hypothetical protein